LHERLSKDTYLFIVPEEGSPHRRTVARDIMRVLSSPQRMSFRTWHSPFGSSPFLSSAFGSRVLSDGEARLGVQMNLARDALAAELAEEVEDEIQVDWLLEHLQWIKDQLARAAERRREVEEYRRRAAAFTRVARPRARYIQYFPEPAPPPPRLSQALRSLRGVPAPPHPTTWGAGLMRRLRKWMLRFVSAWEQALRQRGERGSRRVFARFFRSAPEKPVAPRVIYGEGRREESEWLWYYRGGNK
jgi:hypothetical protein